MKKKTIIPLIAAIALVGQAHAEPGKLRQWLHDKTAPKAEQVADVPELEQGSPSEGAASGGVDPNAKELPSVEVKGQRQSKVSGAKVVRDAGTGCLMGAAWGLINKKLDFRACATMAVGASMASITQQLMHARAVETAAKAAGGQASVQTSQVADAKGKTADKLEALNLSYPGPAMGERSPASLALLDKIAALSKSSKEGLTFTFTGSLPVCRVPIEELGKRGALQGQTVIDHCGQGDYGISISPVPDVR